MGSLQSLQPPVIYSPDDPQEVVTGIMPLQPPPQEEQELQAILHLSFHHNTTVYDKRRNFATKKARFKTKRLFIIKIEKLISLSDVFF
jgi:hypothetical protein